MMKLGSSSVVVRESLMAPELCDERDSMEEAADNSVGTNDSTALSKRSSGNGKRKYSKS